MERGVACFEEFFFGKSVIWTKIARHWQFEVLANFSIIVVEIEFPYFKLMTSKGHAAFVL